jgi:hypothetical protein
MIEEPHLVGDAEKILGEGLDIVFGPDTPAQYAVVSGAPERVPVHRPEQDRALEGLGFLDRGPKLAPPPQALPTGFVSGGKDELQPVFVGFLVEGRNVVRNRPGWEEGGDEDDR